MTTLSSITLVISAWAVLAANAQYNQPQQQIPILKQSFELNPDGTHSYQYETGNGIYEDQQGYPKGPELQAVQGQYQYVSPEGQVIRTSYVADENGFQPQGEHLPTPPPIPEAILRSLKYIDSVRRQ